MASAPRASRAEEEGALEQLQRTLEKARSSRYDIRALR